MMEEALPRRPRWRWILAGLVALIAALLALLWSQREPVARRFVGDALARNGVAAEYRIARIGPSEQLLENVRLGDPARPDLVARRVLVRTAIGWSGPYVAAIEAQGVLLRGRLAGGRLSLGALDRLLPPPSGRPFALPDLTVTLDDARMRLETPLGPVGLALAGRGNLADGFRGRLAAVMPGLAAGGCRLTRPTAFVTVAVSKGKPALDGPVRAGALACPARGIAAAVTRAAIDLVFAEDLAAWQGGAVLEAEAVRFPGVRARTLRARIGLDGDARRLAGPAELALIGVAADRVAAERIGLVGRHETRPSIGRVGLTGELALTGGAARFDPRPIARATAGTPLMPLGERLAASLVTAQRRIDGRATLTATLGGSTRVAIDRLDVEAGAARLGFRSARRDGLVIASEGLRADGRLTLAGGGFPTVRALLRHDDVQRARIEVAPYAAGGARLALAPVEVGRDAGGMIRAATRATLDGPLADGRIEGLTLPLAARIGPGGWSLNPSCDVLAFRALAIAGVRFGSSRLPYCPVGVAMLGARPGELRGGLRFRPVRLAGRSGQSPLTVTAPAFDVDLAAPGFATRALAVRLGRAPAVTRLDLPSLDGRFGAGIAGRFGGAAGAIANVPLDLSEGEGRWRLAGGRLTLEGALRVADGAAAPRFEPLMSRDVRLTLAGGIVRAAGTLATPTGAKLTDVALVHDLGRGAGRAVLDVPVLTFGKALQPEALTGLTLGVIANVVGTVKGQGRIAWGPAGVTSDGDFATDGIDLAAAFGPVKGLEGVIHFSDLLALATPPGQVVTLAEVNPGIVVVDGRIAYQLLPDTRVRIEGGRWPFAGGELRLEPSTLDLGRPVARALTFRVIAMDAAKFVQQMEFDNLSVTGIFDGVLPMVFDATGGRIAGGSLAVRPPGGTLAYVGEVSNAQLGTFGKLAFDALKSMRYRSLTLDLDGPLDGEIVSRVRFDGTNEAGPEARRGMLGSLIGLPFRFRITIKAPFRGLVGTARSFQDPRGLIQRSLGRGAPAIQPPSSGTGP